jgi:hypothetical protein
MSIPLLVSGYHVFLHMLLLILDSSCRMIEYSPIIPIAPKFVLLHGRYG